MLTKNLCKPYVCDMYGGGKLHQPSINKKSTLFVVPFTPVLIFYFRVILILDTELNLILI